MEDTSLQRQGKSVPWIRGNQNLEEKANETKPVLNLTINENEDKEEDEDKEDL